jgi:glycosyltransferase involved in cell wall biosynthesis
VNSWLARLRASPIYARASGRLRRYPILRQLKRLVLGDAAPPPPARQRRSLARPAVLDAPGASASPANGIDRTISVVIPVKNGGQDLIDLLASLGRQRGVKRVEVVIVDSGSTDGSVDVARRAGAEVIEIKPEEFSHSGSRMRGAKAASGDLLVFLTQDALPDRDDWLWSLAHLLSANAAENVVAISSVEQPRPDCDLFYRVGTFSHYGFLGALDGDRIGELVAEDYESLRIHGQLSDIACMIERAVFEKYGFRGDYGEDMDLGVRLIRDGYRIALTASIPVIHSHNRAPFYFLKRAFVDTRFLVDFFTSYSFPQRTDPGVLLGGIVDAHRALRGVQGRIAACTSGENFFADLRAKALAAPADLAGADSGDRDMEAFMIWAAERRQPGKSDAVIAEDVRQAIDRLESYSRATGDGVGPQRAADVTGFLYRSLASAAGAYLTFLVASIERTGKAAPVAQELTGLLRKGV